MNLSLSNCKLLIFGAFAGLVLAGCVTVPEAGPVAGGFHLRGKMGIVQGRESVSARFLWRQQRDAFTIDLWGPLGQGRVQLSGTPRFLELRNGDGSLIDRGPAEAVMQRHLGWSLPLAVLPAWVRGRPAARLAVSSRTYDDDDRLSGFRQLDWQVELARYRPVAGAGTSDDADEAFLPFLVTAHRDAYRVRLAVSDWEF